VLVLLPEVNEFCFHCNKVRESKFTKLKQRLMALWYSSQKELNILCLHGVGTTGVAVAVQYFLQFWVIFDTESLFQINDVNN
jgi:hypothetical protein